MTYIDDEIDWIKVAATLNALGYPWEFIRVVLHDAPADRHMPRYKLAAIYEPKNGFTESVNEMANQSGHFFQSLIEGDLAEAWYRADSTNTRLLAEVFTRDEMRVALERPNSEPEDFKRKEIVAEPWGLDVE